jgi:hypothetical protein
MITKPEILNELRKTIESITWSNREGGFVRDKEMRHAIACHRAAIEIISRLPSSSDRRKAWTKAYWEKLMANPKLYKEHCAKVCAGFLRRRERGEFGPAFKRMFQAGAPET